MKLEASALSLLSTGDVLAALADAIVRVDPAGAVRAKRKTSFPAFAMARDGRLFVADGSKVFEADPKTLALGKRVPFPADRGREGTLREIAVSPDGTVLAGITLGSTLHVQELGKPTSESHPAYGARRECLGFVGPREVAYVHGNTVLEVKPLGDRARQLHDVAFAVAGDGALLAWDLSGDAVRLVEAAKMQVIARLAVPRDGEGLSAAFAPGGSTVLVSSGGRLSSIDTKTRKVTRSVALASPAAMAVTSDGVALASGGSLVFLALPSLEVTGGAAPEAPTKRPTMTAAPAKAAPKKKAVAKAHASAYRTKIERFVEKLRETVTVDEVVIGGPATEAALKAAEKKLGHPLPKDFRELWRDVDGFSITWGGGQGSVGVDSLRAIVSTPSEDRLWNDEYADQSGAEGSVPLAKLKKLRVLWSLPGESPAVGVRLDAKAAALYFGEPNEVFPLPLKIAEYIDLALATGGRFQDALVGSPGARRKGRALAEERMVPGWPKPRWRDFER